MANDMDKELMKQVKLSKEVVNLSKEDDFALFAFTCELK